MSEAASTNTAAAATGSEQHHLTLEHNGNGDGSSSLQSEPEQPTNSESRDNAMPAISPSYKQPTVWAWPWVVFLVFLYTFILFWVYFAILQRYWIKLKWNDALPGLDKSAARKFTMRMHMTMGAVSLILGPFQFIPAFRKLPKLRGIHRWSGRIYCVCAMLSSLFGLWFISLKEKLVGGYNMTTAFSVAGVAIGAFAFKAWQTARAARFSDNNNYKKALFLQVHRDWGIRSYSQILAPALYRYWYIMMELFGLYRTPIPLRNGGYCDEHDQCPDYSRTWDAIYCWVYWMSAWLVAEFIIWSLPAYKGDDNSENVTMESEDAFMSAPLLTNESVNDGTAAYGSGMVQVSETPFTAQATMKSKPTLVNAIGCLLALASVAITCLTFYTILSDSNDDGTQS
jgi:hypothetical protein